MTGRRHQDIFFYHGPLHRGILTHTHSSPPSPLMSVDGQNIYLVVDRDPVSQEQLKVCLAERPSQVTGVVRCDQPEHDQSSLCREVDFFPAFCHESDGRVDRCVYGRRSTPEEFAQLRQLNQASSAAS